jgi:WD40 repeat protein
MDAVSSSVSNDEVDRWEVRAVLQQRARLDASLQLADTPGARFSEIEPVLEADGAEEVLDTEEEAKIKEEQSSLLKSKSGLDNSNELTTGDCYESGDQDNVVGDKDAITMDACQVQVVNTEDTVPLQDENNVETAESSIANKEAADLTATVTFDGGESTERPDLTDIPRTSSLFLPVESDSDVRTNVERPDTTDNEQSTDPSISQEADAQFSTPLHQNTKRIDDCNVLDYCDLTSPLEALYLMCSNQKKGGALQRKESGEDVADTTSKNFATPERMTSVRDVDPKEPAPMSPPEERDAAVNESDSDDDSSSAASVSSINKFRIVDRDTGNIFDVREIMRDIDEVGESLSFDTRYSFLPSKRELQRRSVSMRGNDNMNFREDDSYEGTEGSQPVGGSFDSLSSVSFKDSPDVTIRKGHNSSGSLPTKKKAKAKLSDLKQSLAEKLTKSTLNRKRTASSDTMPRNAIYVKSTKRHNPSRNTLSGDLASGRHAQSSSFNPMLLVKTIPASHSGPAWCAAFSLDGRFLATGGEDGNVCIWAVAPKSAALHPESAGTPDTTSEKQPSTPNLEKEAPEAPDLSSDSPLSTKTDDKSTGGGACDATTASPPPLSFVGSGPEVATNLQIISDQPLQRFNEHTADVIDLSWSHTNFLLTASLDSSVRLYHYSKPACLHLFKHADIVASVAFHPSDERYFISGGIDKKLRMWSITDGRVKDWAQAPDVITAVRFTPDGKYVVGGLFRGQVYFYLSDGLKYCEFN